MGVGRCIATKPSSDQEVSDWAGRSLRAASMRATRAFCDFAFTSAFTGTALITTEAMSKGTTDSFEDER